MNHAATIVLIHGLGGDSVETWGNFPGLIEVDPELDGYEVVSFSYPTSLFRWPFSPRSLSIQTLADALRTLIDVRLSNRKDVILVCHSLGGLIARRYLIDEIKRKSELRVRGVLLYAVPNDGAGLARISSMISWRHNQLIQLCKDSDLLRDLELDWKLTDAAGRVKIRYVIGGLDRVVDERSARSSWGETSVDVVADRGHIEIVKPRDASDLSYLILKKFLLSTVVPSFDPVQAVAGYATPLAALHTRIPASGKGYRVIGFDLDGTLLRGIQFSWTVVWRYLDFPEDVYRGAMRDHRKGKTTYQQWCELACAHFRERDLKRSDFPEIVSGISVTKNLHEALKLLRSSGFITALISGGIDTFIEELIPDAADLFDYICINHLHFDHPSGLIQGVDATPFDFEGKTVALEAICKRHGCTLKEAVFVGEGFNDENVINKAGLSIAYPPGETAIDAASMKVFDDDLLRILPLVL